MPATSETMRYVRELLASMLAYIASSRSFWYNINGNTLHGTSLCNRLGFVDEREYDAFLVTAGLAQYTDNVMKIQGLEWKWFIKEQNEFDSELAVHGQMKFDMEALLDGRAQEDDKRFIHHVIQLGDRRDKSSPNKFTKQKMERTGKLDITPPPLTSLRSKQREFGRNIRGMVLETLINKENVEDADSKSDSGSEFGSDCDSDMSDGPENLLVSLGDNDDDTPAESPAKRQKTTADKNNDTTPISTADNPIEVSPASTNVSESMRVSPESTNVSTAGPTTLQLLLARAGDIDTSSPAGIKQLDALQMEIIKFKQHQSGNKYTLAIKDKNKTHTFVRIPKNTTDKSTDESFDKYSQFLDEIIKENAGKNGSTFKSAKRVAKHIRRKYSSAFLDLLSNYDELPPDQMYAVAIAAMFKAGNVTSRDNRRQMLRHLRFHFGKNSFAPEHEVQMLCQGYTEVEAKFIDYPYEEGGLLTRIEYWQKNIANEAAAQLKRQLQFRAISPTQIDRIDIMTGGDAGGGAFVAGARLAVTLKPGTKYPPGEETFTFEITVAEIICKKDCADLLNRTIKEKLTEGLKTIAENGLNIYIDTQDEIQCTFESMPNDKKSFITIKLQMYVVGDLAFYAIILGKEAMSGKWCHICKLSHSEWRDLSLNGEAWDWNEMTSLAEWYIRKKSDKPNTKPKMGMKDLPWWTFIPISHFIVPLLHCLIGVGDNILNKFRDEVSENIEYLPREEIEMRLSREKMTEKIDEMVVDKKGWDLTTTGKQLASLKSKIYRCNVSLDKMGDLENVGVASTADVSPNQSFLQQIMIFIETDDAGIESDDDDDDEKEEELDSKKRKYNIAARKVSSKRSDIQKQIDAIKKVIDQCNKDMEPLAKMRRQITNRIANARRLRRSIKEKITKFKSERKVRGDGIEAQLFSILKLQFNVKLQAYHGGTMTGKDIIKVMNNASEIFSQFANVLIANKKEDCIMSADDIRKMCDKYADLFVLWDGSFALASKVNPNEDDISLYKRHIEAAVRTHVSVGCSVTPKVHLMYKHVSIQMRFPGGLGHKREDWVEHAHQIWGRKREQFKKTKDRQTRANAAAKSVQQFTDPRVCARGLEVDEDACKGPRKGYVTKEAERKATRIENRMKHLLAWEYERDERSKDIDVACTC